MRSEFPELETLLRGENLSVEYKTDLNAHDKRSPMDAGTLAGALMALGNANGGFLLLGVSDDARVLGINGERKITSAKQRDEIKRKFSTPPDLSSHTYRESKGEVWAFYIPPAAQNPYQLTDGSLRIRRQLGNKQGPENKPFLISEFPSWQAERGIHFDFSSATHADLNWKNRDSWLNPLAMNALESRLKAGRINNPLLASLPSPAEQFEALGLLSSVGARKVATNAALILFGSNEILEERLPGHRAQFQHFSPLGALPQNLFCGQPGLPQRALLLLAPRLEELYHGLVARHELMDGMFRIDIPDYGDDALREATMNAFIHRDFAAPESVVIQLYPQRFFISNPGGFYRDVTPQNLLFHEPCPRNRLLAQACADLGLVEKSGRGVDRIFWDQIRFFRPFPAYGESTPETVRLTLQGGATPAEAVRWMLGHFEDTTELSTRLIQGAFLHQLFFEGELSRNELIESLSGLTADVGRRRLTELIDDGIIVRIGHGRGQRLVLSPQLQSEMGKPGAFVHQVGMGEEYRKNMVLTMADSQESIRRSDVVKLLHVSENEAYRLLKKLVEAGELSLQGQRRYASYERAGKG